MKDLHACVYVCLYVGICIYKRYFGEKTQHPQKKKKHQKPTNPPKTKNPYLTTPTYNQYAKKKKKLLLKIIKREMTKLIRKFKEQ